MLAEIFVLFLEHLIRTRAYADGGPIVVSSSPHVPITEVPSQVPIGPKAAVRERPLSRRRWEPSGHQLSSV
jgi:hypothetical protein